MSKKLVCNADLFVVEKMNFEENKFTLFLGEEKFIS